MGSTARLASVALALVAGASTAVAPPSARLLDFHEVPLAEPQVPPIPSTGCVAGVHAWTGAVCVVVPPGSPRVAVGALPVARVGRMLIAPLASRGPVNFPDAPPDLPCGAGVHAWTGAPCMGRPPTVRRV